MSGLASGPAAVIGGGRMGTGIAHAFVMNGAPVTVVEPDPEARARAERVVHDSIATTCERRGLADGTASFAQRLSLVASIDLVPPDVRVVVEAVPEALDLKIRVLSAVERHVSPSAVLASNTSSLPISQIAARLEHPGRFLGMHFFNPVPASSLVELVTSRDTDAVVLESAMELVAALGKTSIVVDDCPGFATSRLGVILGIEAMRMLEDGVASAEDIDRAMVLGYRHPIGPLRLTDLVGLDVRLAVAEHLAAHLGSRFAAPDILRRKVADGKLGMKAGEGFFVWS